MALTWAGVITILFLAAACVRGYRRGLIKELVSLVCVFLSMAIVWFINPYVNEFIRENTSMTYYYFLRCKTGIGVNLCHIITRRQFADIHDISTCLGHQFAVK